MVQLVERAPPPLQPGDLAVHGIDRGLELVEYGEDREPPPQLLEECALAASGASVWAIIAVGLVIGISRVPAGFDANNIGESTV